MPTAELAERVRAALEAPPLAEMAPAQEAELRAALARATDLEDLPGKWQAAILAAERNRPDLRVVKDA